MESQRFKVAAAYRSSYSSHISHTTISLTDGLDKDTFIVAPIIRSTTNDIHIVPADGITTPGSLVIQRHPIDPLTQFKSYRIVSFTQLYLQHFLPLSTPSHSQPRDKLHAVSVHPHLTRHRFAHSTLPFLPRGRELTESQLLSFLFPSHPI